ncbi:MAG: hypothetical protein ACFFDN_00070 [Candidatus Hodarchaeota archaeon]
MFYLGTLWNGLNFGLNKLVVFRNIKNGKETLKIGKMTFKAKMKRQKRKVKVKKPITNILAEKTCLNCSYRYNPKNDISCGLCKHYNNWKPQKMEVK